MDAALITVMQIRLSEPEGDVLLFLTGQVPCQFSILFSMIIIHLSMLLLLLFYYLLLS